MTRPPDRRFPFALNGPPAARLRMLSALCLTAVLALHAAGVLALPLLDRLEAIAYDARLALTAPGGQDPRIVIVDIDEASLAAEGRWPWRRDRLARLVDLLFEHYAIGALGFDVVFAERDEGAALVQLRAELARHPPAPELQRPLEAALDTVAPALDYDGQFARALAGRPVVLGYYFTHDPAPDKIRRIGTLPPPLAGRDDFGPLANHLLEAHGHGANLPQLAAAAPAGHFNPLPDLDGVVRRVPLVVAFEDGLYESLALTLLKRALTLPLRIGIERQGNYAAIEWLALGPARIPVDAAAAAYIPYRGPQGSFPYVSATEVLNQRIDPERLAGAIVLVGASAPGLADNRSTPVGPVYPGVEVHANLIAGILDGTLPSRPAYVWVLETGLLAATGLLFALVLPRLGAAGATLVTLAGALAVTGANVLAWRSGLILPLAAPLLLLLGLYLLNMAWGYFVEGRNKRLMTDLFGQYVPPALVAELARQPEQVHTEGENRVMTVLFADIRDFTRLSEGLPPTELSRLMNAYLDAMTEVIQAERGTIDKYIGDAIMAFWGAPLADPDHARHAVAAALAMQARLAVLNREFAARGWPQLAIGIGLNSGPMTVGNMGSRFRRAYTVLGDAVNFASRLESLTKRYGCPVLAGETTRAAAEGFVWCEIDLVRVKGKTEAIRIHQPLAPSGQAQAALLTERSACVAAMLAAYRARDWEGAGAALTRLRDQGADPVLCALFAGRIADYRQQAPPPDWHGIATLSEK